MSRPSTIKFAAFGEMSLTADDLACFPDYLVCIPPDRNDVGERGLARDLSSGLPAKVLVQTSSIGTSRFAFGVRSAPGDGGDGAGRDVRPPSPSSNLYALRAQIGRGLASPGPALFSVFSVPGPAAGGLPPYLVAAAALQSRAFPAFSYEASAGGNWAARFSLENNPRRDDDWPVENVEYVDTALQRVTEPWAFTFADFPLCHARHSAHFARVARAAWSEAMLPAADWPALDESEAARRIRICWRSMVKMRCTASSSIAPDAGRAPVLPYGVAQERWRPRFARRTAARAREGGVDRDAGPLPAPRSLPSVARIDFRSSGGERGRGAGSR
jgi:hypothetical protein